MIEAGIIQFLEETTALVVHFFLDQGIKQRTAGDDGETDKHPSSKYKHFQCIEPHYIPFSVQPVSVLLEGSNDAQDFDTIPRVRCGGLNGNDNLYQCIDLFTFVS